MMHSETSIPEKETLLKMYDLVDDLMYDLMDDEWKTFIFTFILGIVLFLFYRFVGLAMEAISTGFPVVSTAHSLISKRRKTSIINTIKNVKILNPMNEINNSQLCGKKSRAVYFWIM